VNYGGVLALPWIVRAYIHHLHLTHSLRYYDQLEDPPSCWRRIRILLDLSTFRFVCYMPWLSLPFLQHLPLQVNLLQMHEQKSLEHILAG